MRQQLAPSFCHIRELISASWPSYSSFSSMATSVAFQHCHAALAKAFNAGFLNASGRVFTGKRGASPMASRKLGADRLISLHPRLYFLRSCQNS
jgi:hypothetical protein